MNKNDQKIMKLKEQIEEKKNKLEKLKRFLPVTNCSLDLEGDRYNLNVLNKKDLTITLIRLNIYLMAAEDLGLVEECILSGYNVVDWINDIKAKIDILSRKDEERNLKLMEIKLDKLLSSDAKVGLELDEIATLLGE